MWKSSLVGAVLALLLVGAVVGLAATHTGPFAPAAETSAPAPTVLALIAPGSDGVLAPAVVDLYAPSSAGWEVRSISPTTPVTVPGTGARTLADAYSFGGGTGLATALSGLGAGPNAHWVLVDSGSLGRLAGSFSLDLPSDIEVFDGSRLYSFSQGTTSVPTPQLPQLLQGASLLSAASDQSVRVQVGDGLRTALATAGPVALESVRSDLTHTALLRWTKSLRAVRRTGGS
jgi:hypothetical protein